VEDVKNLDRGL